MMSPWEWILFKIQVWLIELGIILIVAFILALIVIVLDRMGF
jgi:hypothetical protein